MKKYLTPKMDIDLFEENDGLLLTLSESAGCANPVGIGYAAGCLEDDCYMDGIVYPCSTHEDCPTYNG